MTMTLRQEGDRAIWSLGKPMKDFRLPVAAAFDLAEAMERLILQLEAERPSLHKGQPWSIQVETCGREVGFHVEGPEIGAPDAIPLRAKAAKALADRIKTCVNWAQYGLKEFFAAG